MVGLGLGLVTPTPTLTPTLTPTVTPTLPPDPSGASRLAGDDARDHVCLDGRVLELAAVAEPHADPHEGEGDEEPG